MEQETIVEKRGRELFRDHIEQLLFLPVPFHGNVLGFICFHDVSDLHSETKGSRFESRCYLCAEASSLQ